MSKHKFTIELQTRNETESVIRLLRSLLKILDERTYKIRCTSIKRDEDNQ